MSPSPSKSSDDALVQPTPPCFKSRREFHKRRKESTVSQHMKIIRQGASLLVAATSAFIISQYDPSHKVGFDPITPLCEPLINSSGFQHLLDPSSWACMGRNMAMPLQNMTLSPQASEYTKLRTSLLLNILRITRHFSDPPPLLFLTACVLFGLAVDTYQDSHKADRYQDRILGAGILFGIAIASWMDSFWIELKSYMAASLVLALVLSSMFHRLLGMWPHPRETCQDKLDTGAKLAIRGVGREDLGAPCATEAAASESTLLYHDIGVQISRSGVPMPRTPDTAVARGLGQQI